MLLLSGSIETNLIGHDDVSTFEVEHRTAFSAIFEITGRVEIGL